MLARWARSYWETLMRVPGSELNLKLMGLRVLGRVPGSEINLKLMGLGLLGRA